MNKIIQRLVYAILGLLSLLSLFIIICAFNPKLSRMATDFINLRIINPDNLASNDSRAGNDSTVNNQDVNSGNNVNSAYPEYDENAGNDNNISNDGAVGEGSLLLNRTFDSQGENTGGGAGRYIPTDKAAVTVPEELSGRSDYVPVKAESRTVDDEAADELQLSVGETGAGLDFDPAFYPYYGMLDEAMKSLYRQVYANTAALNNDFAPVAPVTLPDFHNVFTAVFNDHPELFWLDGSYMCLTKQSGIIAGISLVFNQTANNLAESQARFNNAAEEILSGGRNLGSAYEKEVYVHNALLGRIAYNLAAPLNQSAYSALVGRETVCAGYARAFQYLMRQLGVPCYYCTGFAGENHAWNIIKLDQDFYNVDPTWDDTDPNTDDYFNRTDSDFAGTHVREDLSVGLPACNGMAYRSNEEPVIYRSLAEVGLNEEDVLKTLAAYYDDCYKQIIAAGGSTEFINVIDNPDLWLACYDAYDNDAYLAGYADQVMLDLFAQSMELGIQAEALADGRILIYHDITLYQ